MSTKKSIAFIINPQSGTDRIKSLQKLIEKNLPSTTFAIQIHFTKHAGHAVEISKELVAQNLNTIVAVGGDGTVNEVASSMLHSKTCLGIVPKGSGNGLARACGILLNTAKALQIIAKGKHHKIDVGVANGHVFVSNAGVGFDAHVANLCQQENNRGLKMYLQKSVQAFWQYQAQQYLIEIDGKKITQKAFMVSVANGNEFGYGFQIAPTAKLNDGVLDIMIIEPLTLYAAAGVTFKAWRGNIHQHNKVNHLQGKEIKITNYSTTCFQADGDAKPANKSLEIKIIPRALQIIIP